MRRWNVCQIMRRNTMAIFWISLNIEAVKKQLALEKKFVERKLYQKPPIRNE